jgi:sensor histidine kinase YesM
MNSLQINLLRVILRIMETSKKRFILIQVFLWLFSAFLFFLRYKLPAFSALYVAVLTISSFLIFAIIIYGYIYLYNRLYNRIRLWSFGILISSLFTAVVFLKIWIENRFAGAVSISHSRLFWSDPVEAAITKVHFANALASCFFVLLIAILFKSFIESVKLKANQAEVQKKQMEAELNQLKAHVQPHFLFNSLNNLYYDIYKTLPDVANRIEMLSDMMRYFMEESPKALVPISTEIEFIESYIALERVRFHFPLNIRIIKNINSELLVPPMLLIPLVENAFKYGIKNDGESAIDLQLEQVNNRIRFFTKNKWYMTKNEKNREGTGLKNLRERLTLLYNKDFILKALQQDQYFIAELMLPVYEG